MNAPKRWKEPGSEAAPALRSALDYAGKRAPDAAYVAALTGAVLAQVAAPGPALAAASTLKASASVTSGKLLGLTLAAALACGGGAALYLARESAPSGVRSSSHTAVIQQPARAPAREAAPRSDAPALAPEAPALEGQAEPERRERSAQPRRARTGANADELGLLQAARSARRSSETRALALLRQHERSFPASDLREERDALLIELLSRADPRAAAARAADFLQRFPSSAYRARVTGFRSAAAAAAKE